MDTQDANTFLEEFVSSSELLPTEVRRNFELMRELDRDVYEISRQCDEGEKQFFHEIKLKRRHHHKERNEEEQEEEEQEEEDDEIQKIKDMRKRAKQKTDEKIAIAEQTLELVESFVRKIDTDLTIFETLLKGSGEFESVGAQAGQEVAIQPDVFVREWILGRVISYQIDTGFYDIVDVDDTKRYELPESQVILLDLPESSKKLSKGDSVYAVYPDTTAFYLATVSQAPRRSAMSSDPSVTLQFVGDADETGQTPHRLVPLRHVIRPPV